MTSIDTTPDFPAQPEQWITRASIDLPSILQEMPNETGYGATSPGHGQRILLAKRLVEELASKRGHAPPAASWAIHELLQRGLLLPEIGYKIERPIIA
jgi:hypothetical protein